jgi:hypothetical protein
MMNCTHCPHCLSPALQSIRPPVFVHLFWTRAARLLRSIVDSLAQLG